MIKLQKREVTADDLDICCYDSKQPLTNFSRRLVIR